MLLKLKCRIYSGTSKKLDKIYKHINIILHTQNNLLLNIYTHANMRDSVRAQWLTWEQQQQAMGEFQEYVCELAQQQGKLERSVSYVSILVLWEIGL